MEFKEKLQAYQEEINRRLAQIAEVPEVPQKSVYTAMQYSLLAGGKRVRPVLTLAVADMLGADHNAALEVGCALECIHTYSLIHDDLPCMDDDALRRGKPTCHMMFGEATALLAGDGLLNLAAELLTAPSLSEHLMPAALLRTIHLIFSSTGCRGMIGGQVMDLESEEQPEVTLDALTEMHNCKTGALIQAAALAGAYLTGDDPSAPEISKIGIFSSKLGLAFQIKDDILDCTGDVQTLGKQTGSDVRNQKNTFVTALGMDGAAAYLKQLTDEAVSALEIFDTRAAFLTALAGYLLERRN